MRVLKILRLRLKSIFQRHQIDRDLDDELAYHLERAIENKLDAGLSPEDAHHAALRQMGRIQQSREESRDMRRVNVFDNLRHDIRYGSRMLLRNPGFAAIAIVTLALGIGANTAVFSAFSAVLLHPLPWANPDRLTQVWETHPVMRHLQVSYPDYLDWRTQGQSFDQMAAYSAEGLNQFNLTSVGEPLQIQASLVTQNLLPMLGIRPVLGRNFDSSEMSPGRDNVVLISHALWQSRFGSRPTAVGLHITIDGRDFRIVGVLPSVGQFPVWADVLMPVTRIGNFDIASRKHHLLEVIARIAPGHSLQQAQTELSGISGRLQKAFPVTNNTIGAEIVPLAQQLMGDARRPLFVALAAVGLLLLIACANVASLLLARASVRSREVATRIALGAGRTRLLSQFLTESTLLALGGSLLGIVCLAATAPLLRLWASDYLPRAAGIGVDRNVLLFSLLLSAVTGIAFGLLPALQILHRDQAGTLREAGRNSTTPRGVIRAALAAAEIGLAAVDLISAGLLTRSFERLLSVDPGFRPGHVLAFRLLLPASQYSAYPQVQSFYRRLFPRLRSLPGVTGVDLTSTLPLTTAISRTRFAAEGAPPPEAGGYPVAQFRAITPEYPRTMGIALKQGRLFQESELEANAAPVCIVNETLARLYFPGRNAVGGRLILGVVDPKQTAIPVVGVVADTREISLAEPAEPQIYFAGYSTAGSVVVRVARESPTLAASIRAALRDTDRNLPAPRIQRMDDIIQASVGRRRFLVSLLSVFSFLAIALSAIGLYGVISGSIAQRTRELGVRKALGANTGTVIRMVLAQGARLSVIGVAGGAIVASLVTRSLASLLFGLKSTDPATYALAGIALIAIAVLACLAPAWRAARVEPIVALRHE